VALVDTVRSVAGDMGLIADSGQFDIDSVSIIDLVLALETACGISIPDTSLVQENFESVETVAKMLGALGAR
jgi:acyl carrier protein